MLKKLAISLFHCRDSLQSTHTETADKVDLSLCWNWHSRLNKEQSLFCLFAVPEQCRVDQTYFLVPTFIWMAWFWVWLIALVTRIMILVDNRDSLRDRHRRFSWKSLLVLIIFVFSWKRFTTCLTKYWRLVWLFVFFKICVWGKCLRACLAGFLRVVDFKFMVLKFFLTLKVFATLVPAQSFSAWVLWWFWKALLEV